MQLTPAELRNLTGYQQAARQAAWLAREGIRYRRASEFFPNIHAAAPNIQWLLSFLLALPAHACDVPFDADVHTYRPALTIKAESSGHANDNPVTVCEVTVYNVLQGERLKAEGWAQVDAVGELIGVNIQVAYCDDSGCNYSGRWPAPSIHFWGTGNVWRSKGEHHKTQRPVGHYIAQSDQQAVTFKTFVNVYSSSLTPVYGAVLDCGLTVERF